MFVTSGCSWKKYVVYTCATVFISNTDFILETEICEWQGETLNIGEEKAIGCELIKCHEDLTISALT